MLRTENSRKLIIILDTMNYLEIRMHEQLVHGGGQMLKWLLKRMSLSREAWNHVYCYAGNRDDIPNRKADRIKLLKPHWELVDKHIKLNSPCIIIGMGKIACEYLTGYSATLKQKAGSRWPTKWGKAWISYSPDAALFDPNLSVSMYGVLFKAAESAGLAPAFNPEIKLFDWSPYERRTN